MPTRVFFYGLYMDATLLESMGFRPRQIGAARLDNYRIEIGERATLIPARGKSSYGYLHDLLQEEVSALYARPEVRGYIPQPVVATLLADSSLHHASCYVLPPTETGSITDAEYAVKLAALVSHLGLPLGYAKEIEALADTA
jgi:hypothetical protein